MAVGEMLTEGVEGSCRFSLLLLRAAAQLFYGQARFTPSSPSSLYLISLWLSATILLLLDIL